MKRIVLVCTLLLAACQPVPPLPIHEMLPPESVYDDTRKQSYLYERIALGDFSTSLTKEKSVYSIDHMLSNYGSAGRTALEKAGLLAKQEAKATYRLNGNLVDVDTSMFGFTEWEMGSTAEYTLVNNKTDEVVYTETVVVPFTQEKPLFMNTQQVIALQRKAIGSAVAANLAHLVQKLKRLDKGDLK